VAYARNGHAVKGRSSPSKFYHKVKVSIHTSTQRRTIKDDKGFWGRVSQNFAAEKTMFIADQFFYNQCDAPFIELNFEGTCIGKHVVVGTHSRDDSVNSTQPE
jgi:hypothetical protein